MNEKQIMIQQSLAPYGQLGTRWLTFDPEFDNMTPSERKAYNQEMEDARMEYYKNLNPEDFK